MVSLHKEEILKAITQERELDYQFDGLVKGFDEKLKYLTNEEYNFDLKDYFGKGSGVATARTKLVEDKKIRVEWLMNKTEGDESALDFKGLYVFKTQENNPFYVGISRGVINRVNQHIKGNSHRTASLAYKIGLKYHEVVKPGRVHLGERGALDFETYVKPVQELLLNQKVAWVKVENDEELYLFEVYCSLKFKTNLNSFKTH
tara:strand:+ start:90630 stop:91238 length:609 start_codon:yes stop_codon:yes gene_type:complete